MGVEAWDVTLGQATGTWDRKGQATSKDTIHTEIAKCKKKVTEIGKFLKKNHEMRVIWFGSKERKEAVFKQPWAF